MVLLDFLSHKHLFVLYFRHPVPTQLRRFTTGITTAISKESGRGARNTPAGNTVTPVQGAVTMSEPHSTLGARPAKPVEPTTALQPPPSPGGKPAKPYPDFPLTAHPAGYWCKKIKGKIHYFGPWEDPQGALAKYLEQRDALHAGKAPRPDPEALTVKALVNDFLNAKLALRDTGELSPRSWA